MNVLQINTVVNSGSTGRIAEDIGINVTNMNWKSFIAYGRERKTKSDSNLIKIGNQFDFYAHIFKTRFFDQHGFGSKSSTKYFLNHIDKLNIDIIHIHNLHGYYLNIELLFNYFKLKNIPVIWTLHDCWAFTGHCAHYTYVDCQKWQAKCFNCPQKKEYPASFLSDNSENNYLIKKNIFTSYENLTLVPVSKWLEYELKKSFLSDKRSCLIYNGIDLNKFKWDPLFPKTVIDIRKKKIVLGIANVWTNRKGLNDFLKLREILSSEYLIVLIGVSKSQKKDLSEGIIGIERTESIDELVRWYSHSEVLFNPTLEDTYPTVNLESIACGTPVITYNVGGSPESISDSTGFVIEKGDILSVISALEIIENQNKDDIRNRCRKHAIDNFDKSKLFQKYINLYKSILNI